MKETWNYNLIDLLQQANSGKSNKLIEFLKKFPTLAVANEDNTVLVLLRHFNVHYWGNNNRMVTNVHPETDDFQKGIILVTSNDDGSGSSSNIYFPNNRNYTELKINGKEIEIYSDDNQVVTTNVMELFQKLRFFSEFKEEDLEIAFDSLSNEQYPNKKVKKPKVKDRVVKLPSIGKLKYNEELEWYDGEIKINDALIGFSIYHTTPKKLEKLISFVTKQIKNKFYEKILLEMEGEMIELKNDTWLGENEETGEEELPITAKDFRKRISIESMVFYEDSSSTIYCADGDVFWGHLIEINIDEKGNYKSSNLAG